MHVASVPQFPGPLGGPPVRLYGLFIAYIGTYDAHPTQLEARDAQIAVTCPPVILGIEFGSGGSCVAVLIRSLQGAATY